MAKIIVQNTSVTLAKVNGQDYISLTDIAKYKTDDAFIVIGNWMRNRNTIEYLGIWESLYNPDFKRVSNVLVGHPPFNRSRQQCLHHASHPLG